MLSTAVPKEGAPSAAHGARPAKAARVWTVTRLHPAGAIESVALSNELAKAAGYANYDVGHPLYGSGPRATIFNSSSASTDLGPGYVTALDGSREYGISAGAVTWSGTLASRAQLSTTGSNSQWVSDASGGQVVGHDFDGEASFICYLWTAPAHARTIISWSGFRWVWGVGGGLQVGSAISGYLQLGAHMWNGSSYLIDWEGIHLHPDGAESSEAKGTDGLQQVGYASFGGIAQAGFWTGTPNSWTPIHPVLATESTAFRVAEGMQVGYAVVNGVKVASFWESSAGSWEDLGAFLPAEFQGGESTARDISVYGDIVYVVGDAVNTVTGQREAVMWQSSVDIFSILDTIWDFVVSQGYTTLTGPLTMAIGKLNDGNPNNDHAAIAFLNTFKHRVNQQLQQGKLTLQQAQNLINLADKVIAKI